MRTALLPTACALVMAFGMPAVSQSFTPVVAVYRRRVFNVSATGAATLVRESKGRYLRSADGTALKTWQRYAGGQPVGPKRGVFTDAKTGLTSSINYSSNQAEVKFRAPLPLTQSHRKPEEALGESTYDGIPCTLTPVRIGPGGPAAAGTTAGRACTNFQLGLLLFLKFRVQNPSGGYTYAVFDLQDVQLGRAPNPSALALPSGVAIFKR